jgi:glycolate oxidase
MSKKNYNPITKEVLTDFINICGKRSVIYNNSEKLEPYSHDEVSEKSYFYIPNLVLKPSTTDEVSRIMAIANRENIPVTPRGAGSGLSGGCIPVYGGIVLSMEKMNRIIEVDIENLMITVEPGVITNTINEVLKKDGLWFAGYPMSLESCFIGGNVAENAGGGKAIKYGVTSRYVTGLEVVLPTGEILNLGGKLRKDVTGYDLIHLLTGSEGTLGIITKITLSLMPLPGSRAALLALFGSVKEAISVVPQLLSVGRIIPTSIEFMDKLSFQTACDYLNEIIDYKTADAMLLIEIDGKTEDEVARDYETIGDICESKGAQTVYVADNKTTLDRVWNIRKNIAEAFKITSVHQSLEDIVVPTASIPAFMDDIENLIKQYNILIPCYGHAGDGNLHATPVKPPKWDLKRWENTLEKLLVEIYLSAAKYGGTISGEHGIGSKRKDYIGINLSDDTIALMKRLKTAFDPNWILNPGKIFPENNRNF